MIDKETAHAVALEVVRECRTDVDREIKAVRELAEKNHLSEERATEIAKLAADMAVKQITDNFYMGVGKKTMVVIGATIVVMWDQLREGIKKALGF
jgi:hypothetical protein